MFYQALDTGCIGHGNAGFLEAAALAARHGFEGFWFEAGRDFTIPAAQTAALLKAHGLQAAGFSLPLDFRGEDAAFQSGLDKLPSRAAYARAIGITRCATWIMPAHDTLDFDSNFALHKERLSKAAAILKQEGIWLGLEFVGPENMRRGKRHPFLHNLDGILSLCGAIGTGNCGLLLDIWHWQLAGQTFADFNRFSDPRQVVCVHLNDAPPNIPDADQVDQVRRLPGTTGVLNAAAFFAGLHKAGFDGPVMAEPFEPFLGSIPLEDAIRVVKRHLDRVWP